MDLSRHLTDRHEICTQVWCWVKPLNLLSRSFLPPLKIWRGTLKYRRLLSEACNFETAIDKQITHVSFTINALKRYQTWGISPRVLMQPREPLCYSTLFWTDRQTDRPTDRSATAIGDNSVQTPTYVGLQSRHLANLYDTVAKILDILRWL